MADEKKKNDILYLSHSRMDVARACMRKYKYQFVDELKLEQDDTSASDFGSCIHEIAENYKGTGKAELLALYHKIVPSKYKLTPEYKKKVPLALKNVHVYYSKCLAGAKNVKREMNIKFMFNDVVKLTGKIDVMYENENGRYTVSDYKTKKTSDYYAPTDQLAMYMLMLNREHGIPLEKIDCEIVYLSMDPITKKGKRVLVEGIENIRKQYKVSVSDVEILKREIETLQARIKKNSETGEWRASPDKFNCTYCPFNKICEDSYLKKGLDFDFEVPPDPA